MIGVVGIIMPAITCRTHIPVSFLHYHEWHYSDCSMKYTSVEISFTINLTGMTPSLYKNSTSKTSAYLVLGAVGVEASASAQQEESV